MTKRKLQLDFKGAKRRKTDATAKVSASHKLPVSNTSQSGQKALIPFTQDDKLLFIGEGDFSFSASCVETHLEHAEGVMATCLDSASEVTRKYPDASKNITTIEECCGQVRYEVDATRLSSVFRRQRFDVIIFCFPHVAAGISDEARNILSNQKMLQAFFREAQMILSAEGHIAVALATSRAYMLWNLKGIATEQGLQQKTSGFFDHKVFPGYQHKRTTGEHSSKRLTFANDVVGEERQARWQIFVRAIQNVQGGSKTRGRRTEDSEDSS